MTNVMSFFAGCGGSSLGYKMAGAHVRLAVEWDRKAVDTYRLNFPGTPVYHGDINDLSVEQALALSGLKPGELDILDGSPSCQGFSTAAKSHLGRRMNDPRKAWLYVVTSLLSAADFPAEEIVAKYAQRWRVETLFRELKIELSADVLRSKTPAGIEKEIAARVTALNTIRVLMLNAAIQEKSAVLRISFVQTLRTVLHFAPGFAVQRSERLPQLYQRMLAEIARQTVKERLGHQEPRMIRRETKHYPTLRTTRVQWRRKRVA